MSDHVRPMSLADCTCHTASTQLHDVGCALMRAPSTTLRLELEREDARNLLVFLWEPFLWEPTSLVPESIKRIMGEITRKLR